MEVKRKMTVDTEIFDIGDVIEFQLTNGETVKAMAVRETDEGMLFMTVDCVGENKPVFEDPDKMGSMELNYCNSDLRHYVKGELLELFPDEIKSRMVGMRIGNGTEFDLLRIPTEKEIFGINEYGVDEEESKRFDGMENRRNRITFDRSNGKEDWQWYWLQDRHKDYVTSFANVNYYGYANYDGASFSFGVRPVFLLS